MAVKFKRAKKQKNSDSDQSASKLSPEDFKKKVSERAFVLYEKRGKIDGYHAEDWKTAEAQIKKEYNIY